MSLATRNNASRAGFRETWKSGSHRLPAERLFFQLYIGTEVKTLHDTSPQRVKKCDAGTYVVLSGDTYMLSSCQRNRQCQLKG